MKAPNLKWEEKIKSLPVASAGHMITGRCFSAPANLTITQPGLNSSASAIKSLKNHSTRVFCSTSMSVEPAKPPVEPQDSVLDLKFEKTPSSLSGGVETILVG